MWIGIETTRIAISGFASVGRIFTTIQSNSQCVTVNSQRDYVMGVPRPPLLAFLCLCREHVFHLSVLLLVSITTNHATEAEEAWVITNSAIQHNYYARVTVNRVLIIPFVLVLDNVYPPVLQSSCM